MTLRNGRVLEIERGSTRSYSVENSLWKWQRTCRKTDYGMNYSHNMTLIDLRSRSTEETNTLRIFEGKIARKICGPVKEGE
jgi:hypothetical protein